MKNTWKTFILFLNIFVFIVLVVLIFRVGWDTMEQWTYIMGTGLLLLDALVIFFSTHHAKSKIPDSDEIQEKNRQLPKTNKKMTSKNLNTQIQTILQKKARKSRDYQEAESLILTGKGFQGLKKLWSASGGEQDALEILKVCAENTSYEENVSSLVKEYKGLALNSSRIDRRDAKVDTHQIRASFYTILENMEQDGLLDLDIKENNQENSENQEAQNVLNRSQETAQKLEKLSKSAKERFSQFCQDKLDFANEQYETLREELKILQKSWKNEMDDLRKSQYARRIKSKQEELNEINQEIKNIEEECQQ